MPGKLHYTYGIVCFPFKQVAGFRLLCCFKLSRFLQLVPIQFNSRYRMTTQMIRWWWRWSWWQSHWRRLRDWNLATKAPFKYKTFANVHGKELLQQLTNGVVNIRLWYIRCVSVWQYRNAERIHCMVTCCTYVFYLYYIVVVIIVFNCVLSGVFLFVILFNSFFFFTKKGRRADGNGTMRNFIQPRIIQAIINVVIIMGKHKHYIPFSECIIQQRGNARYALMYWNHSQRFYSLDANSV